MPSEDALSRQRAVLYSIMVEEFADDDETEYYDDEEFTDYE